MAIFNSYVELPEGILDGGSSAMRFPVKVLNVDPHWSFLHDEGWG